MFSFIVSCTKLNTPATTINLMINGHLHPFSVIPTKDMNNDNGFTEFFIESATDGGTFSDTDGIVKYDKYEIQLAWMDYSTNELKVIISENQIKKGKKLYTLAAPMEGKHGENLNGKLFEIQHEGIGTNLSCIQGDKIIWMTTKIQQIQETYKEIIVVTENTTYHFLRARYAVPSYQPIIVLSDIYDYKEINYGDGYIKHDYVFNRPVTKAEFVDFLKQKNLRTNEKQSYMFENYVEITGSGREWHYKEVLCYDD